uniref:Uncharacterized protein n=1 Tax=Magallana gigas TaxID=29159 RepID=K1PXM4_MAGGI
MMAFHMRCISQRIRACRPAVDFLQTPVPVHTDKRVQSAVTCVQQGPHDRENHLGAPKDSFDSDPFFRHDLFVSNRNAKSGNKRFGPHKESHGFTGNVGTTDVLQNLESRLGLHSHWAIEKNFQKCCSVPQEVKVLFSEGGNSGRTPSNSDFEKERAKREEYLIKMKEFLEKSLPPIFEIGISFDAYSPNIVLENNYWGKKEINLGLQNYKIQVYKLRSVTALRFIHTRMCLLSTSCDLEENFVRVRWRVLGLKQLAALRRLQTYGKFWKISKIPDRQLEKDAVWYDGISFYYLNEEGLVNKHVITRVEEDSSSNVAPALSLKEKVARKMGVLHVRSGKRVSDGIHSSITASFSFGYKTNMADSEGRK